MQLQAADAFATAWIAAWNRHDLDAMLAHYHPQVRFVSPFVAELTGDPAGVLHGRDALRDYFARALERFPDLHFELQHVLAGVETLTLVYRSVRDLRAAEVMTLDGDGLVTQVLAHYAPRDASPPAP